MGYKDLYPQIIKSPQFQALPLRVKHEYLGNYIRQNYPQWDNVDFGDQTRQVNKLISTHTPSMLDIVGDYAEVLPVVGTAVGAYRRPEAVPKVIQDATAAVNLDDWMHSPVARATVMGLGEALLFAGAWKLAAPIARAALQPFGYSTAGAATAANPLGLSAAAESGAAMATGRGSAALGGTLGKELFKQQMAGELAQNTAAGLLLGAGELGGHYGLEAMGADVGEAPSAWDKLAKDPVLMGVLGVGFMGLGRAAGKLWHGRGQQAQRILDENPELMLEMSNTQPFFQKFRSMFSMDEEEAVVSLSRLAAVGKTGKSQATKQDEHFLKQFFQQDPARMNTPFGSHLLKNLERSGDIPVKVTDKPLTVTFLDPAMSSQPVGEVIGLPGSKDYDENLKKALQRAKTQPIISVDGVNADKFPLVVPGSLGATVPVSDLKSLQQGLRLDLDRSTNYPYGEYRDTVYETLSRAATDGGDDNLRALLASGRRGGSREMPVSQMAVELNPQQSGLMQRAQKQVDSAREKLEAAQKRTTVSEDPFNPTPLLVLQKRITDKQKAIRRLERDVTKAEKHRDDLMESFGIHQSSIGGGRVGFKQLSEERLAVIAQKDVMRFENVDPDAVAAGIIRPVPANEVALLPDMLSNKPPPTKTVTVSGVGSQAENLANIPQGTVLKTESGLAIGRVLDDGTIDLPEGFLRRYAEPHSASPLKLTDDQKKSLLDGADLEGGPSWVMVNPKMTVGQPWSLVHVAKAENPEQFLFRDLFTGATSQGSKRNVLNGIQAGELGVWKSEFQKSDLSDLVTTAGELAEKLRMGKQLGAATNARLLDALIEIQYQTGRLGQRLPGNPQKPGFMDVDEVAAQIAKLQEDQLMVSTRRRTAQLMPDGELIQLEAKAVGGKAYLLDEGQVLVDFGKGKRRTSVVYGSQAQADAGLYHMLNENVERLKLWNEIELQATGTKYKKGETPSLSIADKSGQAESSVTGDYLIRKDQVTGDQELIQMVMDVPGTKPMPRMKALLPVTVVLNWLGEFGQRYNRKLLRAFEKTDMLRGRWTTEWDSIVKPVRQAFGKDFIAKKHPDGTVTSEFFDFIQHDYTDALRARDPGGVLEKAWIQLRKLEDDVKNKAQGVGLKLPTEIERYAPHYMDRVLWEESLKQGASKESTDYAAKVIALVKDQFPEMSDEAIKAKISRIALDQGLHHKINPKKMANLEMPRLDMLDDTVIIKNPEHVFSMYFDASARRIANAEFWGVNHEHLVDDLVGIANTYGKEGYEYSRKVYQYATGEIGGTLAGRHLGLLHDFNRHKLTGSFLNNMSQPLNVLFKTNTASFIRALPPTFWALGSDVAEMAGSGKSVSLRYKVGAISKSMQHDIQTGSYSFWKEGDPLTLDRQNWWRKKIRRTADYTTAVFKLSEHVNREFATQAGEIYFESLSKVYRTAPKGSRKWVRARNGLKELHMRLDDVPKWTEDELADWALTAGKRVSDMTQFKHGLLEMPLWAASDEGRVVAQFKSYTVNQSRLIFQEFYRGYKNRDARKIARMVSALAVGFPLAAGVQAHARKALYDIAGMPKNLQFEAWEEFLDSSPMGDSPSMGDFLANGLEVIALNGVLGVVGDLGSMAIDQNMYSLRSWAVPPFATTLIDASVAGSSAFYGLRDGDEDQFHKGKRAVLRQGGTLLTVAGEALVPTPR